MIFQKSPITQIYNIGLLITKIGAHQRIKIHTIPVATKYPLIYVLTNTLNQKLRSKFIDIYYRVITTDQCHLSHVLVSTQKTTLTQIYVYTLMIRISVWNLPLLVTCAHHTLTTREQFRKLQGISISKKLEHTHDRHCFLVEKCEMFFINLRFTNHILEFLILVYIKLN